MKITETQLRNIVRQELLQVLNEEQLDEGLGKTFAGLALAASIALGGYGMKSNMDAQQAKQEAHQIEQVKSVKQLSTDQKIRLVKFAAGANAIKGGEPASKINQIENDAVSGFIRDGKVSEGALDSHINNLMAKFPNLVDQYLQGLKEIK